MLGRGGVHRHRTPRPARPRIGIRPPHRGPVTAVSGGWTDPDTLVVDIAFLETPHHFEVVCSLPERTFGGRWRTLPLHRAPLYAMGVPRRPR
ncbi:hypothetical protein [Streptomyces hygroscopicus]|uniref:hypothetical protein n=1 Tax=Streptomyces hygroscopicus TaxID=1912 RepID=UPI0004C6EE2C